MSLLKEEVRIVGGCLILASVWWLWLLSMVNHVTICFACRKLRVKRSIKVPAISNKLADIPPDEYSWRKYGQKPIKGSPHPRYVLLPCFAFVIGVMFEFLPPSSFLTRSTLVTVDVLVSMSYFFCFVSLFCYSMVD